MGDAYDNALAESFFATLQTELLDRGRWPREPESGGLREGHAEPKDTEDSASCLDLREGVLFVGDSVEEPIPYLEDPDLHRYAATLEHYLDLPPTHYVAGHGRRCSRGLVEENLAYPAGATGRDGTMKPISRA